MIVHGKESSIREANYAAEKSQTAVTLAVDKMTGGHFDTAACALVSLALSAREICYISRVVIDHIFVAKVGQ